MIHVFILISGIQNDINEIFFYRKYYLTFDLFIF